MSHKDTQSTWEVGNTRREIKILPRKGKLKAEALLQGGPNKGKSAHDAPPRRDLSVGALPLWDPGGRPPREQTLNSKRPVEAMNIAAGINAPQQKRCSGHHRPQENPWLYRSGVSLSVPLQGANHAPLSLFHHSKLLLSRSPPTFVSRPIQRAWHCPGRCRAETAQQGQGNAAIWWLSHPCHTLSHTSPHHACSGALAEKPQCAATVAEYNPCAPPFLFGGILLQCPDCLRNEGECSKWHAEQIDKITRSIPHGHT